MSRYVSPVFNITDLNGAPMVGAKKVFYETGTATLKTIYSDAGLSIPMANPVTAVSSGAGAIYPDIYLDGIYKEVQQDDTGTAGVADGVVLWTRDPVGAIAAGNFEIWLNDSTYNIPEVVYASDDNYYISLVDANQGNEPSVSPAQWQIIPVKDMARVTNPVLNGDVSGTAFLDEDDMASDSATKLASQQSIKAYVDGVGVKQIVTASDKVYQTTTAQIPLDDTIPALSEGLALVEVTITPVSATSRLKIDFDGLFAIRNVTDNAVTIGVMSLIDVTSAGVIAASANQIQGFSGVGTVNGVLTSQMTLHHVVPSPGLVATTYQIRVGVSGSANQTLYINGINSGRVFGGAAECRLTITEIV